MKMTKEQLLARLVECINSCDTENAHSDADDALIEYIADEEIAEAYRAVDKWYA